MDALANPTRTFAHKVADLHQKQAELKDGFQIPGTAVPAKQIPQVRKQKVDLRTSWQDLPEHVLKNTLIRL
jgi:hypothetical protein